MSLSPEVIVRLKSTYEELMWLANRPDVTPQRARAWYTHVISTPMAPKVRRFTGMVSRQAIENINGRLVLEHHKRLALSLSNLIKEHLEKGTSDPNSFIKLIEECEQVNITTDSENHRVQKMAGNYVDAEIELLNWNQLSLQHQEYLWRTKLRGKVNNAKEYAPKTK